MLRQLFSKKLEHLPRKFDGGTTVGDIVAGVAIGGGTATEVIIGAGDIITAAGGEVKASLEEMTREPDDT